MLKIEVKKLDVVKDPSKVKAGKSGRAAGKRFELSVRKDLEGQGYIVCKWANQVDFEKNTLVPAKSKYNPFLKRVMNEGSGFPDFIAYMIDEGFIMGVESKMEGYLNREEKAKVKWLLDNRIFHKVLIARKGKVRGTIIYKNAGEENEAKKE